MPRRAPYLAPWLEGMASRRTITLSGGSDVVATTASDDERMLAVQVTWRSLGVTPAGSAVTHRSHIGFDNPSSVRSRKMLGADRKLDEIIVARAALDGEPASQR